MYKLPIKRSEVENIIEIAKVTREIDEIESGDVNLLEKIKAAKNGVPEHSAALYRAIDKLNSEEKLSLLLIVERGRGTINDEVITGEIATIYLNSPTVSANEVASYIIGLIDLPQYLRKGLDDLDELVK
jgi:hypothetical protein